MRLDTAFVQFHQRVKHKCLAIDGRRGKNRLSSRARYLRRPLRAQEGAGELPRKLQLRGWCRDSSKTFHVNRFSPAPSRLLLLLEYSLLVEHL